MAGEVNEAPDFDRIPLAHFSYGALYQEGRFTFSARLIAHSYNAPERGTAPPALRPLSLAWCRTAMRRQ
jgi:hypothetical protein